ncbi:MBL fold metallo-hydrolase [Thiomicrorhabdus sediminis]|uniref:MBL fold metallo-hydrolase n=1 Tax=Thiomicrorhabdus sediminis TaxID=2580412 RepID=A0A4P9K7G1_9GAMM|nr:MBL fold metallo-hydrolase [Thiomicrorhabdus sediminis]QCU90868.1 MBL fold metallo-hydrolase [Thiomicrorhabdus sediminis]
MRAQPKLWSYSLIAAAVMSFSTLSQASTSSGGDPYVDGFKAYAQEVNSYSNVLTDAANEYIDDVIKTERSVGYIGDELPIPKAIEVANGVYSVIGSMIWHTPSNFGLNNNLSFIIFDKGVFVFNAGANPALAYSLHQQIKRVTDKPVKWVAVENNQGHAYLGASYWVDVGVKNLYSSSMANRQFNEAFDFIKEDWGSRVGKDITKSARNVSDKFTTFDSEMIIDVGGGEIVQLVDYGPGHTPASTSLYVPSRKVVLSGDLGFNERMPVFFSYTDSYAWAASFENMMSKLPADTLVVPGHGNAAPMATIKKQTYDYLKYLHTEIGKVVDNNGTLEDATNIDQSMYKDRPVFDQAASNNAQHVYKELTGGGFF